MKNNKRPIFSPSSTLASALLVVCVASASVANASSPGLLDIYQMAVLHDAQLAQQKAVYEASKQGVAQARSALLPQIQADASYSINDSDLPADRGDVKTRQLSLTLNQSLYDHASWARYTQSEQSLQQAEYTFNSAEQDLITRTADQYFKVLLAQEDVALSEAQEEADRVQWERAKASAEVGLASMTDVLQAKSSYDLSKSNRISAENALDVAYEELMKLTGKPVKQLKTLMLQVKLPEESLDLSEWEQRAQKNNLSVLQLEMQSQVAAEEIEVQKSGHWFTAGLQAKIVDTDYSDYAAGSITYNDNRSNSIGVSVSLPLYSGGGTSAKVTEARYNYQSVNEALRDSREQARLNARVQVRSIERGQSLIAALREAVKSNRAFLEAAEEGYKVGLKSLLEVLTARSNFYNARRNLVEALHAQILNRLALEATAGDLKADDLVTYDALLSEPEMNDATNS
ncbi:TolC family outer membrane protein [Thiomicrorhabdus sp. zzn3]|uniref:TolC family outer membrane protein n=1 Tax=Thiomicrorhabdus sp. zzn3 TaxID=3039775 RepID=UPI0024365972|nr:TolC family outer membrane protein [Thiomicrorhabdus sp. zzn3]MDG6777953.1 TolC family outer membrane protein [Thiomicrorhabdus sp. zzn3]